MKTAKGIYWNLEESEYSFKFEGIEYYFSSIFYLNKFKNNVERFITDETTKLEIKYKILIDFRIYLAISYYKKVEKRGFRIKSDNVEISENLLIENSINDKGEIFLLRK